MLIAIDGIDGCGKSTQVKLLADYYKDKCIVYKSPTPEFKEFIAKHLHDPITTYILFCANHAELSAKIKEEKKIVIVDRWILSTLCYQGLSIFPNDVLRFADGRHICTCDYYFVLDVPWEVGLERRKNRDDDEFEIEYDLQQVAQAFKFASNVTHIDGTLPAVEIHNIIVKILEEGHNGS